MRKQVLVLVQPEISCTAAWAAALAVSWWLPTAFSCKYQLAQQHCAHQEAYV